MQEYKGMLVGEEPVLSLPDEKRKDKGGFRRAITQTDNRFVNFRRMIISACFFIRIS